MEKLSRQVGTSVQVLRGTYVYLSFSDSDWMAIRGFGSRPSADSDAAVWSLGTHVRIMAGAWLA
jgi:hypothetical protein